MTSTGLSKTVEEMSKKVPCQGGVLKKIFLVVAPVAQAGADVDTGARVIGFRVRRIPHQAPIYETADEARAVVRVVGLLQKNGRYLGP